MRVKHIRKVALNDNSALSLSLLCSFRDVAITQFYKLETFGKIINAYRHIDTLAIRQLLIKTLAKPLLVFYI